MMRISGILACMLAAAVLAPCEAMSAAKDGMGAAHSSGLNATKTAKTTKAKKPEAPPQQAYITFFWSKGAEGSSMFNVFREKLLLTVDGKSAGKLSQGEVLNIPVDAGHHKYGFERVAISSEGETTREIDVAPGQTVYFEVADKNEAGFMHTVVPQEVSADQAKPQLSMLKAPLQTATKEAVLGTPAAGAAPGAQPLPAIGGAASAGATAPVKGKPGKKGAAPQAVAPSYMTFYWPKRTSGTVAFLQTLGERFGIAVDGQPTGTFGEGQYVSVPVQPGAHNYSFAKATQVSFNEKQHPVEVAPGQSLYFEIAEEQQGMVTVSFPQQVSAEQGQQALAGLQAANND
jgi:hypothetical protein